MVSGKEITALNRKEGHMNNVNNVDVDNVNAKPYELQITESSKLLPSRWYFLLRPFAKGKAKHRVHP